jgi:hypothetical protein
MLVALCTKRNVNGKTKRKKLCKVERGNIVNSSALLHKIIQIRTEPYTQKKLYTTNNRQQLFNGTHPVTFNQIYKYMLFHITHHFFVSF